MALIIDDMKKINDNKAGYPRPVYLREGQQINRTVKDAKVRASPVQIKISGSTR